MNDREKLIMITGFLIALKSTVKSDVAIRITEFMKMIGLDKIESDYKAGKLE